MSDLSWYDEPVAPEYGEHNSLPASEETDVLIDGLMDFHTPAKRPSDEKWSRNATASAALMRMVMARYPLAAGVSMKMQVHLIERPGFPFPQPVWECTMSSARDGWEAVGSAYTFPLAVARCVAHVSEPDNE